MTELPLETITCEGGTCVIDATVLASRLGLTPHRLRDEMRRGLVLSTTERGEGEDTGRIRLTFRYRAKAWAVVIDRDGSIREVRPPGTTPQPRAPRLFATAKRAASLGLDDQGPGGAVKAVAEADPPNLLRTRLLEAPGCGNSSNVQASGWDPAPPAARHHSSGSGSPR